MSDVLRLCCVALYGVSPVLALLALARRWSREARIGSCATPSTLGSWPCCLGPASPPPTPGSCCSGWSHSWVLSSIVRRRGQSRFRDLLLSAYRGRCAVTGCAVEAVLEA